METDCSCSNNFKKYVKNYYCPWLIKRFNLIDLKVGQETTLRCEGDGSPYPNFEWQQLVEGSDPSMTKILRRANNTVLHIRFDSCELFILQILKKSKEWILIGWATLLKIHKFILIINTSLFIPLQKLDHFYNNT